MTTIWLPSENFNPRPHGCGIEQITLHSGEGTLASDMQILHATNVPIEQRKSAHAYACKNGDLIEMVRDENEAWHAGYSVWGGRVNVNPWALGIESEHRTGEKWTDAQKQTMADWCKAKIERYSIKQALIAAHRWIAPTRRKDPSNWPDPELHAWIAALYPVPDHGTMTFYRTKVNANCRQGPGTTFPVARVIPAGATFGSDKTIQGQAIEGDRRWVHCADEAGFVAMTLLVVV